MAKERIQYFDILKGVAIFLVVMGHVIAICIRDIDNAFLFKLIDRIHMPIFFFIAGYFSYKVLFKAPDIKKRAIQLLIPFFVVSALWVVYYPHSGLQSPLSTTFSGMYHDVWKNGYWFTLVLFEICLIYALSTFVLRKLGNFWLRLMFIIVVWIGLYFSQRLVGHNVAVLLSLGFVVKFYTVFFLGVFMRERDDVFKRLNASSTFFTIVLIIGAYLMYMSAYSWEFDCIGERTLLAINIALTMCVALIAVRLAQVWSGKVYCVSPDGNRIARMWTYLGKESLSIYLLHYFFLFPLTFMQQPMRVMELGFVPCLVVSMVVAAVIVAVTLGANYIISQSKLLSLLLTGKNQYGK